MWCSLFCFYKQKTAYEMRISDWSSDVCSSDLRHHLIIAHDVINVGSDRAQLARMDKEAKAILEAESLEVVADRGYFDSGEILACAEADITITLPKPMPSDNRVRGRFESVEHRSEEHTSELQSLMRISYAVFCLNKQKNNNN